MKIKVFLIVFFIALVGSYGQKSLRKADAYYFEYDYAQAANAYEESLEQGSELSLEQKLNLSESYFKTKKYKKSADNYLLAYKQDTLVDNRHLNMWLESLEILSEDRMIDSIISVKASEKNKEFYENIAFNRSLLTGDGNEDFNYNIFNLEGNSAQSDFSPSFYGERMLFTSGRPEKNKKEYGPSGESYLDIYVARLDGVGQISVPNVFTGISESDYHKATPYFSEKLNSIFYIASNVENGNLAFDENDKNALAIGMKPETGAFRFLLRDLSTSFYYPFYDENSNRLYFAAEFDEGYGGTDIYYVNTNNGQVMSAPINLGPRINTPGNEIAPFMFENSFYFSSDVFYGLGGMDMYRSNILTEDDYGIPINLGSAINSSADEFGFIIKRKGDGLLGYFASNREGGKGDDDIYGFMVNQKPGLKTLTLRGKITEPYGNQTEIPNALVKLLDTDGTIISKIMSDKNGRYRFEIPWRDEVILQASKERYSLYTEKMVVATGDDQETNFNVDIGLSLYDDLVEEKEGQKVVKLKKFYFARGKSNLTLETTAELDKVVGLVKSFPNIKLSIETYTDSRGGTNTNLRLTKQRSNAIKKYLIENGVSGSNILSSTGFGEQKILNNCKNGVYCLDFLHKKNQRSLIVILNDEELFQ